MSGLQFLNRFVRAPKHAAAEAPAAFPPGTAVPDFTAPVPLPAPTFTPVIREPANTRPFPAPASRTVRGAHARTAPKRPRQDDSTLRRVLDGIRALPDAPVSRADRFTADMRAGHKGGLPVFRFVAHKIGWCGLDEDPVPVMAPAERSMDVWHEQARVAIDAQVQAARAEISGTLDVLNRYEVRRRAAADAAISLGYPGSDL